MDISLQFQAGLPLRKRVEILNDFWESVRGFGIEPRVGDSKNTTMNEAGEGFMEYHVKDEAIKDEAAFGDMLYDLGGCLQQENVTEEGKRRIVFGPSIFDID